MRSKAFLPRLLSCACVLAGLALLPGQASAVNLVQNGGFETGDFTSWTQIGDTTFNGVQCSGAVPEGKCDAFFGPTGTTGGIQQSLSTVAGVQYLISFLLLGDGSVGSLLADFGGATLLNSSTPASGTTSYSFLGTATAANSLLRFQFRDDIGFVQLDGIQVTAVPEPSSLALLGVGVTLVAARRRRSNR